jgi:hypothetical protein
LGALVRFEIQSTLFNRRACGVLLAGALLFVAIYVSLHSETPSPARVPDAVSPLPSRRVALTDPPVFSAESLKRTIIENNLFRPLGWTPPRPIEPYRLIGTILPTDDRTPPTAIIETTAGQKTYIVTTGEQIDAETEVVSIQGKAVRLSTEGQTRTLKLTAPHFLNTSRVSPRIASQRERPVRRPPPRAPSAAPSSSQSPSAPDRVLPLSEWQTREGEVIRIGDARLKNPAKWGLLRR